jgi:hypothetical protein
MLNQIKNIDNAPPSDTPLFTGVDTDQKEPGVELEEGSCDEDVLDMGVEERLAEIEQILEGQFEKNCDIKERVDIHDDEIVDTMTLVNRLIKKHEDEQGVMASIIKGMQDRITLLELASGKEEDTKRQDAKRQRS